METQVFEQKPKDFDSKIDVAAAYIEIDGKFLFLQLSESRREAKHWGVPAGKLEVGENLRETLRRELFEETSVSVLGHQFSWMGKLFMRKTDIDYTYHLFKVKLDAHPKISLSGEHTDYTWISFTEAKNMPLMSGAYEALKFYTMSSLGMSLNAYLILRREKQILLHLRKNTGYCDGQYGLVAEHVEANESATAAMMREAREEAGIELDPSALRVVHTMHRQNKSFKRRYFFRMQVLEWRDNKPRA